MGRKHIFRNDKDKVQDGKYGLHQISKMISDLRSKSNMNLREFSEKLKVSLSHVSSIETTFKPPSQELLEHIIETFIDDPAEKKKRKQEMLINLAIGKAPAEIRELLTVKIDNVLEGKVSENFINMLKTDITKEGFTPKALSEKAAVNIEALLAGRSSITPELAGKLASLLGKDRNKYIMSAGFLTAEISSLAQDNDTLDFLNYFLHKLSQMEKLEDRKKLFDLIYKIFSFIN